MPESTRKHLWACGLSLLILVACLTLIMQLEKSDTVNRAELPTTTYLLFFTSVALIYALSLMLWRHFYSLFGSHRSSRDAFLDMGLIAIGKYLPGKIWGIALRGSLDQNRMTLNKGRMLVSGLEQAFSLITGILVVAILGLSILWGGGWQTGIALMGCGLVLILLLPAFKWVLAYLNRIPADLTVPTPGRRLLLGAGYCLLWVATAAPIMILMQSSMTLSASALLSIAAAFLGSMIAGWLALFAPGGIGVRESVFVLLAPDFLAWNDGLYWIAMHRGLFTLFDLIYGFLVLALIAVRARSVISQ